MERLKYCCERGDVIEFKHLPTGKTYSMNYVEEDKLQYHVYIQCSDIWLNKKEWEATRIIFQNTFPWAKDALSDYAFDGILLDLYQSAERFAKDFPKYNI